MPVSEVQKSAAWAAMHNYVERETHEKKEAERQIIASLMPSGEEWEAYLRIRQSPTFCHKMLDRLWPLLSPPHNRPIPSGGHHHFFVG